MRTGRRYRTWSTAVSNRISARSHRRHRRRRPPHRLPHHLTSRASRDGERGAPRRGAPGWRRRCPRRCRAATPLDRCMIAKGGAGTLTATSRRLGTGVSDAVASTSCPPHQTCSARGLPRCAVVPWERRRVRLYGSVIPAPPWKFSPRSMYGNFSSALGRLAGQRRRGSDAASEALRPVFCVMIDGRVIAAADMSRCRRAARKGRQPCPRPERSDRPQPHSPRSRSSSPQPAAARAEGRQLPGRHPHHAPTSSP